MLKLKLNNDEFVSLTQFCLSLKFVVKYHKHKFEWVSINVRKKRKCQNSEKNRFANIFYFAPGWKKSPATLLWDYVGCFQKYVCPTTLLDCSCWLIHVKEEKPSSNSQIIRYSLTWRWNTCNRIGPRYTSIMPYTPMYISTYIIMCGCAQIKV